MTTTKRAQPSKAAGAGDDSRPTATALEPASAPKSRIKVGALVKYRYEHPGSEGQHLEQTGFVVELVDPIEDSVLPGGEHYDAPARACVAWITGGTSGPIDVDSLAPLG